MPAVDRYIRSAQPFAQPILAHLREAVHRAVPDAEESLKWSRPFFLYRGVIVGNMAAFKGHCSFGLWGSEMAAVLSARRKEGAESDGVESRGEGMGSLGRITTLEDLPPLPELEGYLRQAAELIGSGVRTQSVRRVAKPGRSELVIPEALAAALERDPTAGKAFAAMSPSHRREYAEWIGTAKREETRLRRVNEAVATIAEGKGRNWRYESAASKASGRRSPATPAA